LDCGWVIIYIANFIRDKYINTKGGKDMETIDLLKKVRIFHGLEDSDLDKFAGISTIEEFSPESVIIEENTEGQLLFIIKKGTVTVTKIDGEVETELTKLVAGEAFGEMSLIEDAKTSARVSAYNDVECVVIGREAFVGLVDGEESLGSKIWKNFTMVLSERLRFTSSELVTWKPDIEL
jgi:CRP/FNR family transcriptional regulator, cyclic AMP receptor protein